MIILKIIYYRIENYCNEYAKKNNQSIFMTLDQLSPVVNISNCFDDLRVDKNHVSRKPSDTYYVNDQLVQY